MVETRDSSIRVVIWGLPGSQELHLARSGATVSSRRMPSLPKVSVVAKVQEQFHASLCVVHPSSHCLGNQGKLPPNALCTLSCTNLPRGHLPQQGLIQRGQDSQILQIHHVPRLQKQTFQVPMMTLRSPRHQHGMDQTGMATQTGAWPTNPRVQGCLASEHPFARSLQSEAQA